MNTVEKRSPAKGNKPGFDRVQGIGLALQGKNTTSAPFRALRRELWIVLNAAHRMAAGYGLAWPDYDRLHQAHQFILKVMEVAEDE